MSEHIFVIPEGVARERVDKVLAAAKPELSRAGWQRLIDQNLILRDGVPVHCKTSVNAGETLVYSLPEAKPSELKPVDIPLEVLFEDEHLVAINKASGMIVHPGAGTGEDTLVHALLSHCEGELSGIGGVERPGIVHRLDRETSGVMLVAKTDAAHRGLAQQFSERTLHKEYIALVDGTPRLLSGVIDMPIGRHPRHRHKMAVVETPTGGRDAVTDWQVVQSFPQGASLVRCVIHTGRTHQIRVHLKWLGHILLGDEVYGWKKNERLPVQPQRVMLHAEHLVVTHPITGQKLDLRAPLPTDFASLLSGLRGEPLTQAAKTKATTKPKKKAKKAKKAPKPLNRKKPTETKRTRARDAAKTTTSTKTRVGTKKKQARTAAKVASKAKSRRLPAKAKRKGKPTRRGR